MQQLLVSKQAKYLNSSWTTRVITMDPSTGVVYLSRKDSELSDDMMSDDAQHKVFVTQVVMWPHFKEKHIGDGYDTTEAALTLRLKGFELPYTAKDRRRRLADASYVPHDGSTSGGSQDAHIRTLLGGGDPSSVRKVSWMLRCTSLFALRELVDALTTLQKRCKIAEDTDSTMNTIHKKNVNPSPSLAQRRRSSTASIINNRHVTPKFEGSADTAMVFLAQRGLNLEQRRLSRDVRF